MNHNLYRFLSIALMMGMLVTSCYVDTCLTDRDQNIIKSHPDGWGNIKIVAGEGNDTAILWMAHNKTFCGDTSVEGVAKFGETGKWYQVLDDTNGNPMILVLIKESESRKDQLGWIDCRFVEFNPLDATFEENAAEQEDLANSCFVAATSE